MDPCSDDENEDEFVEQEGCPDEEDFNKYDTAYCILYNIGIHAP